MACLSQLVLLDPFVFSPLSSCGALATQVPMAGEVILSKDSTQTLPTKIWDAGSGIRKQRQGPNFHNASRVTCPLISAFLGKKKKKGYFKELPSP